MPKDEKNTSNPMFGKPWSVRSVHETYEAASAVKEKLKDSKALQVKIKRAGDNTFKVKVRSTEEKQTKGKKKKSGKGKKKS
jgi:hypothetical protein